MHPLMTEYRVIKRENQIKSISVNFKEILRKSLKIAGKTRFLSILTAFIAKLDFSKALRAILIRF